MRDDALQLILERDAEFTAISAASRAAARGNGSLVLVTGPGGIGKTALLEAAGQRRNSTDPAPGRVLTARGLALERGFSFGTVRQLFDPVRRQAGPEEWAALLDGAARSAGRVFGFGPTGTSEPEIAGIPGISGAPESADAEASGDSHAAVHGLYWLTANLAAREPLLIIVDDAQWADAASLRWLSHLAARIDGLPVAVLLAVRSGPDQPDIIDEFPGLPSCTLLAPRPLSPGAAATVVRARLGSAPDGDLCAACHEATGGNPFLLHSLLDELRGPDGALRLTAADVAVAAPRAVAAAVLRRVRRLGDGAEALTRAVAVLGGSAALRHAAVLAGEDLTRAAEIADSLRAANVLAPVPTGAVLSSTTASRQAGEAEVFGQPLEFAHPIVETAIYQAMPPGERAIAHGRTAALLEADGADAERVALHLLRGEPAGDPGVVAALRAAAGTASSRGAPDVAASYLRRALAEPPGARTRPDVLLDLGLALASVRDDAAVGVLSQAVAQAPPGARADAAVVSAGVLGVWGHHESALRICQETLDSLESVPAGESVLDGRDSLEAALFAESWLDISRADRAWSLLRARQDGARQDGTREERNSVGGRRAAAWHVYESLFATLTGKGRRAALDKLGEAHAEQGWRAGTGAGLFPAGGRRDSPVLSMELAILLWNDEFRLALRTCDQVLDDARQRGSKNLVAEMSGLRAICLARLGRLRAAVDAGRSALELRPATAPPLAFAWAAAHLIDALVALGDLDEAEKIAGAAAAKGLPDGWLQTTTFLQARGALRVRQRRYQQGLDDLLAAARGWNALGVTNPAVASWRTAAVAAQAALKREEEAAVLAAEQVSLARAAGARLALGIALRVSAPFEQDPLACLRESVYLLTEVKAEAELARALTDLGACLRRDGRRPEAQRHLRHALEIADRTGAQWLASAARREAAAAGTRPRRTAVTGPDSLTGAERQVTALAVTGLTNRQIAQQLFISRSTVETHLRHAFHKLGISSRSELLPELGD
jgi:DNA-binding CsgD family transcriptional regulator